MTPTRLSPPHPARATNHRRNRSSTPVNIASKIFSASFPLPSGSRVGYDADAAAPLKSRRFDEFNLEPQPPRVVSDQKTKTHRCPRHDPEQKFTPPNRQALAPTKRARNCAKTQCRRITLLGKEMTSPAQIPLGFSGHIAGRDGSIVYREGARELAIYWEVSGAPRCDIAVGPLDFKKWTRPIGEEIPEEKQLELLSRLRKWCSAQNLRTDVHLPEDVSETDAQCASLACECRKLRHSAYCRRHYDLMCLGR